MRENDNTGRNRQMLGAALAAGVTLYGIAARRNARRAAPPQTHGRFADWPSEIPGRGWWDIVKRVWVRTGNDNISMMAAAVGFYGLLSLFPGLTALISLYGLIADPQQVRSFLDSIHGLLPAEALNLIAAQTDALVNAGSGKLGLGLAISLLFALWTTNYATAMLITALNGAFEEKEKRSYIKVMLAGIAMTSALVLFGIIALLLIAVLPAVIGFLPFPHSWRNLIGLVRWPILAILIALALSAVYRFGPSRELARWRWVSWGAIVATLLWVGVSYGFSFYVQRFSSYDKTYGSLGAVAVLMMWLYLSAYVVLLGAELNAEIEHQTARDSTTGRPLPMGRRGARKADTAAARD